MSPLLATAVVALGPATTLGMARFAYGLALPSMKADLALSYAQSGWLNTANAVGYLLGALPAAAVIVRLGARRTLLWSMSAAALAICASGFTRNFEALSLLRMIAGIAGALTFVAGGSIASRIAAWPGAHQGLTIGVYLGGVGLGIVASGLFVPSVLAMQPPSERWQAWQIAWLAIGGTSLLLTALAWRFAPAEKAAATSRRTAPVRWPAAAFAPAVVAYFLYGVGYIGYLTFIVAYLGRRGFSVLAISTFWTLLGVASFGASWLWAQPIDRLRGGKALSAILGVLLVGNALPLLSSGGAVSMVSALLFGASFTAVPASMIALFRRGLPEESVPSAIGLMTGAFAAGQIVGPVVSGGLADWFGGVAWGLGFSVATLAAAIVVASVQRDRGASHRCPPATPAAR